MGVRCTTSGPNELTITFSIGAELGDVLFIQSEDADAAAIGPVLVRPVYDVYRVVGGHYKIYRISHSRASELVSAN